MASTVPLSVRPRDRGLITMLSAIGAGAAVGVAASVTLATIAHAAGVSTAFRPLQFASYTALVVIAAISGAIGWRIVRTRSSRPRQTLARLVPAVVLVSMTPDILVGLTKVMPHATWAGVATLMIMHLAVAAALVGSYRYFLPPNGSAARR